jgi:hypothetical protein
VERRPRRPAVGRPGAGDRRPRGRGRAGPRRGRAGSRRGRAGQAGGAAVAAGRDRAAPAQPGANPPALAAVGPPGGRADRRRHGRGRGAAPVRPPAGHAGRYGGGHPVGRPPGPARALRRAGLGTADDPRRAGRRQDRHGDPAAAGRARAPAVAGPRRGIRGAGAGAGRGSRLGADDPAAAELAGAAPRRGAPVPPVGSPRARRRRAPDPRRPGGGHPRRSRRDARRHPVDRAAGARPAVRRPPRRREPQPGAGRRGLGVASFGRGRGRAGAGGRAGCRRLPGALHAPTAVGGLAEAARRPPERSSEPGGQRAEHPARAEPGPGHVRPRRRGGRAAGRGPVRLPRAGDGPPARPGPPGGLRAAAGPAGAPIHAGPGPALARGRSPGG